MKVQYIIIIFILATLSLISQERNQVAEVKKYGIRSVSLSFGAGISSYDVSPIKEEFHGILSNYDFPAKITDDVPNYPNSYVEGLLDLRNFSLGLFYNIVSSGGRIAYSDYSGSYTFDTKVSTSSTGIMIVAYLKRSKFYDICVDLKGGFSTLELSSYEKINVMNFEEKNKSSVSYNHLNINFGGRANFYYAIFKFGIAVGIIKEFDNKTTISNEGGTVSLSVGLRYLTAYGKSLEN